MEVRLPQRGAQTIRLVSLVLVCLGLGLSLLTWNHLRHQSEVLRENLLVASRAVMRGIEGNLVRAMGGQESCLQQFSTRSYGPTLRVLLQEIVAENDVRFVAVFNPKGNVLVSSLENTEGILSAISSAAWPKVIEEGEWYGELSVDGRTVFVLTKSVLRPLPRFFSAPRRHFGEGSAPEQGGRGRVDRGRIESLFSFEPTILAVGFDLERHFELLAQHRQTLIAQTAYILLLFAFIWILGAALIRRRNQSERLRILEHFQSRLLDNLPLGVCTVDGDGTISGANRACNELLDCPDGILGLSLDNFSEIPRPKDGRPEWVEIQARDRILEVLSLSLAGGSNQFLVVIRDRTAQKRLETDLHRAERLAAIGRMAASMAHEIRNPLSSLRGFAQFLGGRLDGREPEATYARTMVQEADRLNRVVTDLLYLANPRKPARNSFRLGDVMSELHALLAIDLQNSGVRLDDRTGDEVLVADRDLVKQALLNVLMNALSAVEPDAGVVEVTTRRGDEGVFVEVHDNGSGMNEEERQRALEPFYTTRSKGTGLGLAIVQQIMAEHGGRIDICSASGQGCTVKLWFPDPTDR
ncbi:MAG: hypothetical protein EOM25_06205 [Deltaproteobacteria bacterium]|nr:hypothetical protein [Deltaproteobacteria bacterium]